MHALDALGNPTRRRLLELILEQPRAVSALSAEFPDISRPAISRHLRVLREAQLIEAESQGQRNVYRVRPEGFADVRSYLDRFYDDALARFRIVAENLP